jgi:hypothetical protein
MEVRATARGTVLKELSMLRRMIRPVLAVMVLSAASPVCAAEGTGPVAPSSAVAAAWAMEGAQQPTSTKPVNLMLASYAALQGLDMVSTVQARQAGAREANPVMAGGYGQATAVKAALTLGAIGAVKLMGKKNRKTALVTAVVLNVASAAVVATNMRNTRQLSR